MDKSYFPFIWVFVFITISEISRYILVKNELYTPLPYNLNYLISSILYLILFFNWNKISRKIFLFLCSATILFWIYNYFIAGNIHDLSRNFHIYNSLLLVFLCLIALSKELSKNIQETKVYKNSMIIICFVLIIYNTYRLILVPFANTSSSYGFFVILFGLNKYLLIASYFIFAIAVLWIPKKKNYSLQF